MVDSGLSGVKVHHAFCRIAGHAEQAGPAELASRLLVLQPLSKQAVHALAGAILHCRVGKQGGQGKVKGGGEQAEVQGQKRS